MNRAERLSDAQNEPIIELRDVSMGFRYQSVLRDINLAVRRGETLCIIGESGCGKTVMLKLIIGLLRPSQGSVYFDGHDVASLGGKALVKMRLRFGFLFQMAALFDSLSVFDNVAFGLREHHYCEEERVREIVAERLREVGLPPEIESKKPAELSGGQRKRVGLARALAIGPEVMLYDEPTTGLDPIMSDVINELILQTQRGKKTTGIVVTHDMKTVAKVADRVVVLYPLPRLDPDEPQILYDGPPQGLETCGDRRVVQFVRGEAGERLREMALAQTGGPGQRGRR
jgi:phospholipid/cholesterol/gamma-HCH transport system ATP-binding protein